MDTMDGPERMFYGGFGQGLLEASPLFTMRLRLDSAGLTLEPTHNPWSLLFRRVLPHWAFSWSEVKGAQRVYGLLYFSPGVLLTVVGRPSFTFWTYRPRRVLEALAQHGVPVETSLRVLPYPWV